MVCGEAGAVFGPYVDESRYLLAEKNVRESAKVLEHRGFGTADVGMADRFVEIPAACFQPVKTVMDLVGRK